jgi:hypothetical protein
VARHISTDPNIDFGRWLEIEVWIETRDRMYLADWHLELARQLVQLIGRKIPEASLDGPKFVEQEELLAFAVPEP